MTLKDKVKKLNLEKYTIYFVLVGLCIIMSICSSYFLKLSNITSMLSIEVPRAIFAMGMGVVMISGGIDLSVGSIAALASVVSASLVQDLDYVSRILPTSIHTPVWVAVLAGLLVGLIFGFLNGWLISYFKLPPFIATLGVQTTITGIAYLYTDTAPVSSVADGFKVISQGRIGGFPIIIIYAVVLAVIFSVMLKKTKFGKRIYAIGGNESAARITGVNISKTKIQIYCISGLMAAFAGILLAGRAGSGNALIGKGYELNAVSAAAIGGVSMNGGIGSLGGIIVGVLILGVLNNGMLLMGLSTYIQEILQGVIIIVAVTIDLRRTLKRSR